MNYSGFTAILMLSLSLCLPSSLFLPLRNPVSGQQTAALKLDPQGAPK